MSQIRLFLLAALVCLPVTASSAPHFEPSPQKTKSQLSGSITNGVIDINSNGEIKIHIPEGTISLPTDSLSTVPKGLSVPYAPCILGGPGQSILSNPVRLSPVYTPMPDPVELLNHIGIFFSTASGGFGSRINYDHKISPHTRFIASPEFITYGLSRSRAILGDLMPLGTTRITLIAIPIGLQHHFAPTSRINPHIGFGFGPIIRLDHRSHRLGYYRNNLGLDRIVRNRHNSLNLAVPLTLDGFPSTSLTLGGHLASGLNIHFGAKKELALTIEGRYTLARFIDAMGSPGDFSGLSLAIGFGKAF
ncbi:MAG: hypothetical protein OXG87_06075 [Gemmatimonadetes bacterium]|nr:hypothetical protein [Gemmatimonadota bacterium]